MESNQNKLGGKKVEVYKYSTEYPKPKRVFCRLATFHGFGVDHCEFEAGPGNFSAAIIEHEDGQLEAVHVNLIKFIKPGEVQNEE